MLTIETLNPHSKADVERFVRFPFDLYRDHPLWVPPILDDTRLYFNQMKHPFYDHSEAAFFLALREGEVVGRIAALVNNPYNEYHDKHRGQFYLFESIDDQEVADALFEAAIGWARERGLNQIMGPKGFNTLDAYGILTEGFEHRPMMTMTHYNYDYYPRLVERAGFRKEVDFVSCYVNAEDFFLPERVHSIARRVQDRGTLRVKQFNTKRELRRWARRIGEAYNQSFVNNWEYYPISSREIDFIMDNVMVVANPRLIKIILAGEDVVGFLFAFPDISDAMQRIQGRLWPFGILHLLRGLGRASWVAMNGAGILPEYQGRGGNALLYAEMYRTLLEFGFKHVDMTQIAESAVQMRRDLVNLGGRPYKNHRVYIKEI